MSVATGSAPTSPGSPAGRRGRKSRTMFLLAAIAGLIFVVYVSTKVFGRVSGEEFSPDSFERRDFEYYEIPLVHLQITPISRTASTNSLEHHLTSQKLISPKVNSELRWDLVRANQGAQQTRYGDAAILCAYLDASDEDGNLVWETWTKENSQLASVLWAAIDRLADQRLYLLVPDVFSLAERLSDATELRESVDRTLADRYETLARAQNELGHLEAARELAAEGLRYAPRRETLRELGAELEARPSREQP